MDVKIVFLLLPFWIGAVIATLWVGFIRPKTYKLISELLEKACFSPDKAISAKEAGVSSFEERCFLNMKGALGDTVKTVDGKYYVPEEKKEKAAMLYGKKAAPLWQAVLWAAVLTVFFAALAWAVSKFVDTSAIDVPWLY